MGSGREEGHLHGFIILILVWNGRRLLPIVMNRWHLWGWNSPILCWWLAQVDTVLQIILIRNFYSWVVGIIWGLSTTNFFLEIPGLSLFIGTVKILIDQRIVPKLGICLEKRVLVSHFWLFVIRDWVLGILDHIKAHSSICRCHRIGSYIGVSRGRNGPFSLLCQLTIFILLNENFVGQFASGKFLIIVMLDGALLLLITDLKALGCRLVDNHGRTGWLNRSYSTIIQQGVVHKWDSIRELFLSLNDIFFLLNRFLRRISRLLFLKPLLYPTLDFVLIKAQAVFTLFVDFLF